MGSSRQRKTCRGDVTRRSFVGRLATGAVAAGLPFLSPACSSPGPGGFDEPPGGTGAPRPNIVLLMTDQHRADCLGCDGNNVIRTPNLDRVAREGARFSCAYSATPTCTPARSALLTGLSPWHHGMLGYRRVSNEYPLKLPQAVRDAGYYTFGIGKMHWFPQKALNRDRVERPPHCPLRPARGTSSHCVDGEDRHRLHRRLPPAVAFFSQGLLRVALQPLRSSRAVS
jgi:hypothetical protein